MVLEESPKTYTLQEGDVLEVKFFYNPELNEREAIRPDGMISLQLIDDVAAAGLTPLELDRLLTEMYSKIIRQPAVTVIVKEFSGQKVYIGGEVNTPGLIPISGKLTALQAILQANGFKNTAEPSSVVILRNQGTATPQFIVADLSEVLKANALQNDVPLRPYDIVIVPMTTIGKMDLFVEQYIDKLLPISRSIGLSYSLNPSVTVKQK